MKTLNRKWLIAGILGLIMVFAAVLFSAKPWQQITSRADETVAITIDKVWSDDDDADHIRPGSITMKVKQNGREWRNVELSGPDWSYEITDAPKYDADGNAYDYSLEEEIPDGYESQIKRVVPSDRTSFTVNVAPSEDYPMIGREFTYTITVVNDSDSNGTMSVTDTLGSKVEFVSATDGGTYSNGAVKWTGLAIPAKGTKKLMVTAKITQTGKVTNTANVNINGHTATGSYEHEGEEIPELRQIHMETGNEIGSTVEVGKPVTAEFRIRVMGDEGANYRVTTDGELVSGSLAGTLDESNTAYIVVSKTVTPETAGTFSIKCDAELAAGDDTVIADGVETAVGLVFANITAREPVKPTYTITWKDYNGTVLKTVTLNKGEGHPSYDVPASNRDGYRFTGWATQEDPDGNIIYTAQYEKIVYAIYTVKQYNASDGSLMYEENRQAEVGTTVTPDEFDLFLGDYIYKENDSRNVASAVVRADGSTVLKLYFEHCLTTTITSVQDGGTVDYTVTVTNASGYTLYGASTNVKMENLPGFTPTFSQWKVTPPGGSAASVTPVSGGASDLEHEIELLPRGTAFQSGQKVVLTFRVDISGTGNFNIKMNATSSSHMTTPRMAAKAAAVSERAARPITFTVTNTHETVGRKNLTVSVDWDDAGHEDERPVSLSVKILRNGKQYETLELSADDRWTGVLHGVLAEDPATGTAYSYTAEKPSLPEGYDCEIDGGDLIMLNITYNKETEVPEMYTVTYEPGSGRLPEGTDATNRVEHGTRIPLPGAAVPASANEHFSGWVWGNQMYRAGEEIVVTHDMEFTAQYNSHTGTEKVVKAATCTEKGQKAYICNICGVSYGATETDALGHDLAASWSDRGDDMHEKACSRCSYKETQSHSYNAWHDAGNGKDARECTICGHTETKDKDVRDFTVTYDAGSGSLPSGMGTSITVTEGTQMTVAGEASAPDGKHFTGWKSGSKTYKPGDKVTVNSDMAFTAQYEDHKYEDKRQESTSCTDGGLTWKKCTVCGHETEKTAIDGTGHKYVDKTEAGTCVKKGASWKECSVCGDIADRKETGYGSHEYVDKDKAATCTEKGSSCKECSVCGDTTDKTETPALGHAFSDKMSDACDSHEAENCKGHGQKCTRCGEADTKAHEFGTWKSEKTSTHTILYRTCACGHKQFIKAQLAVTATYNAKERPLEKCSEYKGIEDNTNGCKASISYRDSKGQTVTPKNAGKYTAVVDIKDTGTMEIAYEIKPAVLTASYKSETIRVNGSFKGTVEVDGFLHEDMDMPDFEFPDIDIKGIDWSKPGTYTIKPYGGKVNGNYVFKYVEGILTITTEGTATVTYPAWQKDSSKPKDTSSLFTKETKITVDVNEGTWEPEDRGFTKDGDGYTRTLKLNEHITLDKDPVREGHTFIGWTKSSGDGTARYTAQWNHDHEDTNKPGTDDTDKPGTDKPGTDKPGTDKPGTDKPGTDKPGTDKPGTDKPGTDKPGTDKPGTDKPEKADINTIYNGKEQPVDVNDLTVTADGTKYTGSQLSIKGYKDKDGKEMVTAPRDAGNYTVEVLVKDTDTTVTMSYVIKPAVLTVTTESAKKVYDGKPLTAHGSIKGIMEGDEATITMTGSQTETGESKNTYELDWGRTNKANYTVEENLGTLTVTDKDGDLSSGKTSVKGAVIWDDSSNKAGARPKTLKVDLYKDGKKTQTASVSSDTAWEYEFKDLPEGKYTVKLSEDVKNYKASVDGYKITMTYEESKDDNKKTTRDIVIKALWTDNNDKDGKRPDSTVVILYQNGRQTQKVTLAKKDGWKADVKNLPAMDKDGKQYVYSIGFEKAPDGYSGSVNGFVVTFKRGTDASATTKPTPTTKPSGTKPSTSAKPSNNASKPSTKPGTTVSGNSVDKDKGEVVKTGENDFILFGIAGLAVLAGAGYFAIKNRRKK